MPLPSLRSLLQQIGTTLVAIVVIFGLLICVPWLVHIVATPVAGLL